MTERLKIIYKQYKTNYKDIKTNFNNKIVKNPNNSNKSNERERKKYDNKLRELRHNYTLFSLRQS